MVFNFAKCSHKNRKQKTMETKISEKVNYCSMLANSMAVIVIIFGMDFRYSDYCIRGFICDILE